MVYYKSKAKKKLSNILFLDREFMVGENELKRYMKSPSLVELIIPVKFCVKDFEL